MEISVTEYINYLNLIIFIASILTNITLTIIMFRLNKDKEVSYKRIINYKTILNKLEPHLYKYRNSKDFKIAIKSVHKLIKENRLLIGYDLYDRFYITYNVLKDKSICDYDKINNFNHFCNYFLHYYNKLCKSAGIPHITLQYRRSHKMFPPHGKIKIYMKYIILYLESVVLLVAAFSVIFMVVFFFFE